NDISKGEFTLIIPTEMTVSGLIKSNLILLNEDKEQVIVSKNLTFISDDSTVTSLTQEVNNKIDDFTKLLLENMPQVMRSELNDLHAQTESNKSNIELKANLADMTSLQSAMTDLKNEVESFGISHENLVTIKSLLDAIASNASESEVVELINSVKILTSNISLMSNGDYSPKANQTDLESLQHTVNNQSATISTKANQTDLDNLQATVDKQGVAISTKAEQSELSITNKNVTTAQETAKQAESE
ncbi:phage baseplate upper protein, partial [Lactococcus cremoris]